MTVCKFYYPPICDSLIDRGKKCYYGVYKGKECPPKGELIETCSGNHLEAETCKECDLGQIGECDLSFTIKREET